MSLSLSQAAARLGVSVKALRLYEEAGLLAPGRTAAGWRSYGPAEIARGAEIAALRALGLSLAQVGRVLAGDETALATALDAHEAALKSEAARIADALARLRTLRLAPGALSGLLETGPALAFDLPWPWGGEPFALPAIAPITWITGPLGSGKTRLARRIAEVLPDTRFLPLDRAPGASARLEWLLEEGAAPSDALSAVLAALDGPGENLVIDLVEQGLDAATQQALAAHLRLRPTGKRCLFLMTRSTAMLDLGALTPREDILFCPANHSPPMRVSEQPGARGYEAVESCLAAPEVRARTEGMVAVRPVVQ